jgi:hypothetical protein
MSHDSNQEGQIIFQLLVFQQFEHFSFASSFRQFLSACASQTLEVFAKLNYLNVACHGTPVCSTLTLYSTNTNGLWFCSYQI